MSTSTTIRFTADADGTTKAPFIQDAMLITSRKQLAQIAPSKPRCAPSTYSRKSSVANSRKALNLFTWSLQGPGLGKKRSHAGCALKSKYGALIPAAMAMNIARMIAGDCVNAKPSAVPRNGAVHGVASTVANTPWKNEPSRSLRSLVESKLRVTDCGNEISKTPKRFSANTSTITLKTRTKYGFVN